MSNTIARTESRYYGKRINIITSQLPDGRFETIVMYPDGFDLDIRRTETEQAAEEAHAAAVALYERLERQRPLTGRYAQLAADLRAADNDAFLSCATLPDGGTCNFDAPALYLPRWNAYEVERAARKAGLRCFKWKLAGQGGWYVFSMSINGQADRRAEAAERMTNTLKEAGYTTFCYQQMD